MSWQKWPATPPHGPDIALRYSGEIDNGDTSGSIREAPLGTVSGSLVVSDPPGNIGDKPGNVVTQFSWAGLEQDTLQAAIPRSVSTLKVGDAGRLDRDSQSTSPFPIVTLSRSWVKIKSRSKLCEGQPLCYSALRCCLVFSFSFSCGFSLYTSATITTLLELLCFRLSVCPFLHLNLMSVPLL